MRTTTARLLSEKGPLWFRGLAPGPIKKARSVCPALLKKYKVKRFVTAHTPQPSGRIATRFGNTLYHRHAGMLDGKFYPNGGRRRWRSWGMR